MDKTWVGLDDTQGVNGLQVREGDSAVDRERERYRAEQSKSYAEFLPDLNIAMGGALGLRLIFPHTKSITHIFLSPLGVGGNTLYNL